MATTTERAQRKAPVQRVIVYVDGFNLYEVAKPEGFVLRRPAEWN